MYTLIKFQFIKYTDTNKLKIKKNEQNLLIPVTCFFGRF